MDEMDDFGLLPGLATKAQGYSRWGSDLKKLVPIAFVYLDDGWNADKKGR